MLWQILIGPCLADMPEQDAFDAVLAAHQQGCSNLFAAMWR